jgi:hypothetical protein
VSFWKLPIGEYRTGWYHPGELGHPDYQHPLPLEACVTSDPELTSTMESPQDRFDESQDEIRLKPLDYEVAMIAANIQSELNLDWPDPVEPAPPSSSPALHTMSLRRATDTLQNLADTLQDTQMVSPPPVYALMHPLGLAYNVMPLGAPSDTLQIASSTVATMLTHTLQQVQIQHSSGEGPPGGQPAAVPIAAPAAPIQNGNQGLMGKELTIFDRSQNMSKKFIQEFELYVNINEDNYAVAQPYRRIFLALSYMKGSKINNWVRLIIRQTVLHVTVFVASLYYMSLRSHDLTVM